MAVSLKDISTRNPRMTWFGKCFADVIKDPQIRSSWTIQVGPESMNTCPDNRQKRRWRHAEKEKAMCRGRQGSVWCSCKPRKPEVTEAGVAAREASTLEPCPFTSGFQTSGLWNCERTKSYCFKLPSRCPLLQQPQETETEAQPALELRPLESWEVMNIECVRHTVNVQLTPQLQCGLFC